MKTTNAIPQNVPEAIQCLFQCLDQKETELICSQPIEKSWEVQLWMRLMWDLWTDGPLVEVLGRIGINDPTEMSNYILSEFIKTAKGNENG